MPAQLNHTIVHAKDTDASARFLADILGLPKPKSFRALRGRSCARSGTATRTWSANGSTAAPPDRQAA